MTAFSFYNLADTFWVAKLGYQYVAAITVVMPIFLLAVAFGIGTGVGINALSSRRFGERNSEATNYVTGQIFFLTIVLGTFFILLTNLLTPQLLILVGATPDIMEPAGIFLQTIGWAMPAMMFSLIMRNVFQAAGDAVTPMIFTVAAVILNIILDPFFIFGIGFFPEMGIKGAAVATIIANGFSSIWALFCLFGRKSAYRIRLKHCVPDFRIIRGIYSVGLPTTVMEGTECIVFIVYLNAASNFGSEVLAAFGIGMRIIDLIFMPIIGTANGLLPIVGYSFGARLWSRLWDAVKKTALTLTGIMLFITVVIEIFAPQIIRIFNAEPELVVIAIPAIRILCSSLPLLGVTIIFITTFQGLSKGAAAWALSFARQVVFYVPAIYIFSYLFGLTGLWVSLPAGDLLGALVALFWILREYRIHKKRGYLERQPPE
jgi:putative MATE family efflux protein